jgi:crossover junction endodeoxyribonuclease RuvC
MMRIMGIDPGLATMGWGVIEGKANAPEFVAAGIIQTVPEDTLPRRLTLIDEQMEALIAHYQPAAIVFEQLFFAKNVTTALTVGAARGVAIARCARYTQALYEYTPMQIKQAVVGYGKADKQQVQRMIQLLLKLPAIIQPDDAADAVAAALTHYQSGRFGDLHIMK